MSYFTPYVDGSGLHLPTYQDILADMIASMKKIYGSDIYLGNDSADYQFLSILALKVADSYQACSMRTIPEARRLRSERRSTP